MATRKSVRTGRGRGPKPPARTASVRRRKERAARAEAHPIDVAVADLDALGARDLRLHRVGTGEDRVRLTVRADSEGLPEPRRPEVEPIRLTSRRLEASKRVDRDRAE